MGDGAGQGIRSVAPQGGVNAGALSALLEEIARAPERSQGEDWDRVLRPGLQVGKFQLVRQIGSGGFGVVWEARDLELGRRVAFKAVRAGRDTALREERLLREAEAAARLSHPNLVTLHDLGRSEHGPYLVLELLHGQTLEDRLAQGSLPPTEAIRIAAEVAKGVAHAHAQGVVHRDLKPANVFLCEDGQVKVLDFGLAHAFGTLLQEGGTPSYMAPEQWEGAPEDERTDVYALGVMIFRLLAGELPFPRGQGPREKGPAPRLQVPWAPALGELVGRMLELRPVDRPRHGGEVAAALRALQRELERTSTWGGAPSVKRRRTAAGRAVLAAGLATVALALLVAAALTLRGGAGRPGPGGRSVVVVTDVVNETGERELDALSGLLITALEQSRRLSVPPRGRLFDLAREAGHGDVTRIDEGIGREIARRARARVLVVTSVHRLGGSYAVQLRALDPERDEPIYRDKEVASGKEAIFGLLDRLATRTGAALGGAEDAHRAEARPPAAPTTSLEAYEHYFRGLERHDRGDLQAAAEEYRLALAGDPEFAMAHYGLSTAVMALGAPDEERRAHAAAAARDANRLPERQRLMVQGWYARTFWQFPEMARAYRALLERYPDDKRALLIAASGMEMGASDAEFVREAAMKVLALDRTNAEARFLLFSALILAERLDEALEEARRWEAETRSVDAADCLALVHVLRAEPDQALQAVLAAGAVPGRSDGERDRLRFLRARVRLWRDELEQAEAEARGVPAESLDRYDYTFRALLSVYRGRPREAEGLLRGAGVHREQPVLRTRLELLSAGGPGLELRAAARALSAQSGTIDGVVAAVLALGGEVELAAEMARRPNAQHAPALVEALRLRRAGDLAGARRALEALRHGRPAFVRQAATFALGEACQAAGDDRCAVEALRAFRWMDDPSWRFESRAWAYPRSLLLLARSQERLGERQAALATADRLLAMWRQAEPDFAPLAEARALRDRLAAAPGAPQ